MGFKLTMKWGPSVHPSFSSKSSSWPFSYSFKGSEVFYGSVRTCFHFGFPDDRLGHLGDPVRVQKCMLSPQVLENDFLNIEGSECKINRWSGLSPCDVVLDSTRTMIAENLKNLMCFQDTKVLYFRILMKNLHVLEETVAGSGAVQLERDILKHLERLGALKIFQSCLLRTPSPSTSYDLLQAPSKTTGEPKMKSPLDDLDDKVFVHSVKKGERKRRRKASLEKGRKELEKHSKTILKDPQLPLAFTEKMQSNSRSRKQHIARNEAELSKGVQLVAELERIRNKAEEETGEAVSISSWAKAAAIDKKVLLQRIHFGWYCRDELLRSTRSLILYIAKNYRGHGLAFDDLVLAGSLGVLQGAERFDHTRGYKFSTYVQYWIRKSISKLIAQHARGIRIPPSVSKAIDQVRKARKTLTNSRGNSPDLSEIASFTGLSAAKIISANSCLKVVGSLDQKVGDWSSTTYLEMVPDLSMKSPEATVVRKHMEEDLHNMLEGLEARERYVVIMRYGLRGHGRKSLEEIGRLLCVSKEWVRRIERKVLAKLQEKNNFENLSHFLYME